MSRRAAVLVAVVVATSACTGGGAPDIRAPSPSVSSDPARVQRWAEDIAHLLDRMEVVHPDLYHGVSSEELHAAADALVAELATLADDEVLVGIMGLVAMISSRGRDGHMGLWPPDNPDAVHRFPIRVWEFSDGLFVTAAREPNEDLVGSRIVSVDGVPVDEVFERLDPVVPRDNESNLRAARSVFLTSAEVLSGLGIAGEPLTMELEVELDGVVRTAAVPAVDGSTYADWVGGWELLLPERPDLRFLEGVEDAFRLTYLRPSRTLYVQYNAVEESSAPLVGEIEAAMLAEPVDQLVLDLRSNGGGEAGGYDELLEFLTGDRPDLSVLIGRLTFSAATSLAVLLERSAEDVVFVGEASGGAPNFWADTVPIALPNSGLRALVSGRYFGIAGPGDDRPAVEPDVAVAVTSADYFSGRDPVLVRALQSNG